MRATNVGVVLIFVGSLILGGFQARHVGGNNLFPYKTFDIDDKSNCSNERLVFHCPELPTAQGLATPRYQYPGEAFKLKNTYYPTLVEAVLEVGKNHNLSRWAANFGAKDVKRWATRCVNSSKSITLQVLP